MVNICSIFAQLAGAACPLCGDPGEGLCRRCDALLPRNTHACTGCALPLPASAAPSNSCADCQAHAPSFDRVLAPLVYQPPVDALIAGFKYHHRLPQGRMVSEHLATAAAAAEPPALLLPIPMPADRMRERGFNQASEIACLLARRLDLAWSASRLVRRREALPQRGLSKPQRRRNLRGVFACRGRLPPHVALVDDVMTTGATASAAADAARKAGAEVWVLASTPHDGVEISRRDNLTARRRTAGPPGQ